MDGILKTNMRANPAKMFCELRRYLVHTRLMGWRNVLRSRWVIGLIAAGLTGVVIWLIFFCEPFVRALVIAAVGLVGIVVWPLVVSLKESPTLCAHCREDITTCKVLHCFLCGHRTVGGMCDCDVNESWWAIAPFRPSGPIQFCPNCGKWVGSNRHRWRPRD